MKAVSLRVSLSSVSTSSLLTWLIACLLSGCGQTPPGDAAPVLSSLKLQRTPFSQPLSVQELDAFRQIVQTLPGGVAPGFSSALDLFPEQQSNQPEIVAEICRRQYRAALDPFRQAELWKHDTALMECLNRLEIEPEALAMLQIRVSSSWAAAALLDDHQHIPAAALKYLADERVEKLTAGIHEVDSKSGANDVKVREHLIAELRETVALSEFMGLIAEVPVESAVRIKEHHAALESLLPEVATAADFERRLETTATVIPVGYDSLQ